MSHKLLSIGIPVYNFSYVLSETLNSILPQAVFSDVDILVFDGNSTDDTRLIVTDFQRIYKNLKYIKADFKGGIDVDMVKTVEYCNSDYVWLFSGDDKIKPGSITKILKLIEDYKCDLYLLRHDECSFEFKFIKQWPVLNQPKDKIYNLQNKSDRIEYFESAITSEALFSFMGGLIINRSTWLRGKLIDELKTSHWAHIYRLWNLTARHFTLYYVDQPFIERRAENDSFSSEGMLRRLEIQIADLLRVAEMSFGDNSWEIQHVKRLIKYEVCPNWFNAVEADLDVNNASIEKKLRLKQLISMLDV